MKKSKHRQCCGTPYTVGHGQCSGQPSHQQAGAEEVADKLSSDIMDMRNGRMFYKNGVLQCDTDLIKQALESYASEQVRAATAPLVEALRLEYSCQNCGHKARVMTSAITDFKAKQKP